MSRRRFLRTTVARLSMIYILVFAAGASLLLIAVYGLTVKVIDGETDNVLQAELQGLAEQYSRFGLSGLAAVIRDRSEGPTRTGSVYLLTDQNGTRIVGNMSAWPGKGREAGSWVEFQTEARVGGRWEEHPIRAALVRLTGGYHLLVGTDIVEQQRFKRLLAQVGTGAVILIVLLGVSIGIWTNRRLLRQVSRMATASREIADGDFGRRLPVRGTGDEFDVLATDLNQLLDRIEQLTVALKFVIDGTAHDLKGPLNRLRVRAERGLAETDGAARAVLDAVLNDALTIQRTLDSLLRIAQAQSGAWGTEWAVLSLGKLVQEMAELYEPVAEERGVSFVFADFQNGKIRGSRQLLAHAIANLIDNALKYTPHGGEVVLRVAEADSAVSLVVEDSGPGIPNEDRTRVLERFVRLESTRAEPGTGLGLSLVAAVCRLHHADLALDESDPGLKVILKFQPAV